MSLITAGSGCSTSPNNGPGRVTLSHTYTCTATGRCSRKDLLLQVGIFRRVPSLGWRSPGRFRFDFILCLCRLNALQKVSRRTPLRLRIMLLRLGLPRGARDTLVRPRPVDLDPHPERRPAHRLRITRPRFVRYRPRAAEGIGRVAHGRRVPAFRWRCPCLRSATCALSVTAAPASLMIVGSTRLRRSGDRTLRSAVVGDHVTFVI